MGAATWKWEHPVQNGRVGTHDFRLQIKIMRELESRRQRSVLMKYIILRQRQKYKFLNEIGNWDDLSCGWFQKVWNTYDDELFQSCFRISRETFNFILNRIGHHLIHDTTAEEPISPQERLRICLYRRWGDYYQTSAEMTGRGMTTVLIDYIDCITQEVCEVIVSPYGVSLLIFLKKYTKC